MQKPLYALLFASLIGCGNAAEKPPAKPDVKPVVTPDTKPVASAPTSSTAPAALAVTPPPSSDKQLIYDPRVKLVNPSIPAETQEKLLSKLFPKRLKSMKECKNPNDGSKTSEEDIADGQLAPSILSSATGAFTSAGAAETAYVVDLGECHAEMTRDTPETSSLLVVVAGEEIKLKQKDFGSWEHLLAFDLDQDGLSELATISEYDGMDASKYLQLAKLKDKEFENQDALLPVHDVYYDSCYFAEMEEGGQDGNIKVSVSYFTPTKKGELPTFTQEHFIASCKNKTEFKPAP